VADASDGERLVLVGHSFGGLSVALAMEKFPRKVAVAVFVTAAMPCAGKRMGVTLDEVSSQAVEIRDRVRKFYIAQ
jgi:pimeloyl-ACP methyl ester carboxylesterase